METTAVTYPIRRAEPRDLEAVNRLLEQVLAVHHAGRPDLFRASGKKYSDEQLLRIFSNPDTPVFVYDDGAVRGYVFCAAEFHDSGSLKPVKTLYVDDLCVDVKSRGRHIGKALFDHVREYAKDKGFYNITLHVWECNPGAKAFYRSLGLSVQYSSMELVCQ